MQTPVYIIEEARLRENLQLIARVAREADVEIILAFKAFALWKTFHIFREYINSTTASSLSEARLAVDEFGAKAHTFSPAYTDGEIDEIVSCSSHLTFNSLSQYERFYDRVVGKASIGLRVNPEYSEVGTMLYNPCAPGTRFGITADKLPEKLPTDIQGFHCHCHCESGADVLERTLVHIEGKFAKWFPQLKWLNLGGGHLMTRKDYDIPHLINILKGLHQRYPWLHIILEPGSAFAWQTGPLVSHVVDVVEDKGIRTAILDVSFTCHMPDCLEMPYHPEVRGAKIISESSSLLSDNTPAELSSFLLPHSSFLENAPADPSSFLLPPSSFLENAPADPSSFLLPPSSFLENAPADPSSLLSPNLYRLGGNSCLSGDFMGYWQFDHELQIGEEVIFEDMIHYTTVKTCMFNGISHPAIAMLHADGKLEILRQFGYEDYKNRMD